MAVVEDMHSQQSYEPKTENQDKHLETDKEGKTKQLNSKRVLNETNI